MNIFILSEEREPLIHYQQQAHYHIDKHVVKMIAESTQMLVTAASQPSFKLPDEIVRSTPCKPLSAGMMKHPCTMWTCADIKNFNYLACLALQLCWEHQYRYPLSAEHAYMQWLTVLVVSLTRMGFGPTYDLPEQFAVAIKNDKLRSTATSHVDALSLYRDYYVRDKRSFATWKKRLKPMWFLLREELIDAKSGNL
jgi:hypothetical protein